jgi:hypothetical protein
MGARCDQGARGQIWRACTNCNSFSARAISCIRSRYGAECCVYLRLGGRDPIVGESNQRTQCEEFRIRRSAAVPLGVRMEITALRGSAYGAVDQAVSESTCAEPTSQLSAQRRGVRQSSAVAGNSRGAHPRSSGRTPLRIASVSTTPHMHKDVRHCRAPTLHRSQLMTTLCRDRTADLTVVKL